jgi:hypothetical protein
MRHRAIVSGLLLVSAATAAQAQDTVISRQITTEPVETVVTTGPNGTVITRRPLAAGTVATAPAPVVTAPAPILPPFPFAPFATPFSEPSTTVVETVETVEQPAVVTQEVVRPAPRRAVPARTVSTTRVVERPAARRTASRSVAHSVALTPQQRQVIRRTVLLEQARPAMAQQVVSPPLSIAPPASVRTVITAPVVQRINYVGSALPRDVVIYDMPQSVAVPAVRPYSYAVMDDRVLLVDPATRVVVEDLSP